MKLRLFAIIACILSFGSVKINAQKLAVSLGYEYFDKSAGFVGTEYRLDKNNLQNKHGPLNIGVGTYLYGKEGRFSLAPEAHINQTWWHVASTELSVSTKNIKPSVGLSFFNLFRMQFGYSFPFTKNDFKGFYFGFRIHIGRAPFYDEIQIF